LFANYVALRICLHLNHKCVNAMFCPIFPNLLNFSNIKQEQGIEILNKAIAACTETIETHKGKLVVKEGARAVSILT